ncbi:DUF4374 domain-containing protein [Algoriphagus halophytocola]|uniref:DUF4374 domain-containing protein n=1 Tax=Algoriphagus halophytocola TaxID=2991499 RepID=A0ABY6MGG8_9BACT|nr:MULTISPECIES: DUF4374 domain-containing protein [unclassified Algoriphagus]UZD22881.1 DUF4374 domain-containing protein [Algoriphagus sp. TR-M5]WBL44148.1 DUF4374 domain-containing protein [Algoriphagus sp. TR-M9]
MKTNFNYFYAFAAALTLGFSSCDSDDPEPGPVAPVAESRFIIASTPLASDGVADYLLTAESLTEGTVSTVGNGVEQDGTYRYYVTHKNKFFSMLYGQGNPGAVTTYELNAEGALEKLSDFQSETVQAFGPMNDDIVMAKISRNSADPLASWYRLDADQLQIVADGKWDQAEIANNGEQAFFTWVTQVGDKLFAPYFSIKACCNDRFGTVYPDSAWIAVFDYPSMELNKVIKDNRTSFIGRYFLSGLEVDEMGDTYAFSPSIASSNGAMTSTLPSAFTRIKAGELEFDQFYYFNVEELADDYYITAKTYAGNGKFILTMNKEKGAYTTGNRFGVADVYNKTFTWVTGAPSESEIVNVTINNYSAKNGLAYIGITTETGSWVFEFNANTATAKEGLKVEGGVITAISKLDVAE